MIIKFTFLCRVFTAMLPCLIEVMDQKNVLICPEDNRDEENLFCLDTIETFCLCLITLKTFCFCPDTIQTFSFALTDAAHCAGRGVSEDHRAAPGGEEERGHRGAGRHCTPADRQGNCLPQEGRTVPQWGELLQNRHCKSNLNNIW